MSIAHYNYRGDSYWLSNKQETEPDTPEKSKLKSIIESFNWLLFEHDHPIIDKIKLYGIEIKLCNQKEIENLKWTKERIDYYITDYRSTEDDIMSYGSKYNYYDNMKYRSENLKRTCKRLLDSLNNNLTYKLSKEEIDFITCRAR
jgi:hypothetical protein